MPLSTPAASRVPTGALSKRSADRAMNSSDSSPARSTTIPGLVQNCPVPMRQEVWNSSAMSAPRSRIAPGSTYTGLMELSSR